MNHITITEYLNNKGIAFRESGGELVTKCLFGGCDDKSRPNEAHLYFNAETSQYDCKKCEAQGNIVTLAKHLGDSTADIALEGAQAPSRRPKAKPRPQEPPPSVEHVEALHAALPERIRTYLNERGIPDHIVNEYKLGWGEFYGRNQIVIPIKDRSGAYALLKLRKDPEDVTDNPKMMVYPKGAEHEIYGWDMLAMCSDEIVLCEGEFDRLLLLANGIFAVTSTGGTGTFKDEWAKEFLKVGRVIVCYDNDEAGIKGTKKVLAKLLELDHENVCCIDLPMMSEKQNDVTDYFMSNGGNPDTFMKLIRRVTKEEVSDRIAQIQRPFKPTTFEEWHEVITANFPDLTFPAEICLSIVAQILILDITNPFALVLIGAPSAGKTICINFFDGIEELTYASDKFTTASFVTNASNVAREKLAELDLLPRLKNKTFLIRDMATIFSKPDDALNECLGTLTRVLDGDGFSTDTGLHGQRDLSGPCLLMMIGASTRIPGRVWKNMSTIGPRIFFYTMMSREKPVDELVQQLKSKSSKEKEGACRKVTHNLLYTLWGKHPKGIAWDRNGDQDSVVSIIVYCAKLLAGLRGQIGGAKKKGPGGEETEDDNTPPSIEHPDRISTWLHNFARAHAVVTGRTQIELVDLKFVIELAIESAPPNRAQLFRALIDHGGVMTTTQVELCLSQTKPSALVAMRTLVALGICTMRPIASGMAGGAEIQLELRPEFKWFASEECRQIRGVASLPILDTLADLVNR